MKAILHDVSRCRGCMRCVEKCSLENHLVEQGAAARFEPEELSEHRFTTLETVGNDHFVRRHCLHCVEPSCASACLVGALHQTEEGPVVYDSDKCIGCRYCMLACPFTAVRYEWGSRVPLVKKCEMCYGRPDGPACVEACKYDATMYGERDDLLRIAHERIRANPGTYIDHVWGEQEMGGTCVLFVSDVSLDDRWPLGAGEESIPDLTKSLVESTPFMALGVASLLISTSWVIGRRNRLAVERAAEKPKGGSDRDA